VPSCSYGINSKKGIDHAVIIAYNAFQTVKGERKVKKKGDIVDRLIRPVVPPLLCELEF